jgi:seryl-tRNA synthetase
MHDIKFIRDNPTAFDEKMKLRGFDGLSDKILKMDEDKRKIQTQIQELQQKRKITAKEIGKIKSQGGSTDEIQEKARSINEEISILEAKIANDELTYLLSTLPNFPSDDTPIGNNEDDNKEIRKWGTIPEFNFEVSQHFEIGENIRELDFATAANMSGSRFSILKGSLARLERALSNFMLNIAANEYGYTEVSPPVLVHANALYGTGQLPKFEDDLFKTTGDHYLIPTAEVPLTNMVANKILDEKELPLRYTAYTQCFRLEAGSAGKDTRGLIRKHQFSKVELVSIVTPENSADEQERMLSIAEKILQTLEIPYRVVQLCTGDLGFAATKTYDIEVWLPGQNTYREISSISNCNNFQARRMKARYKPTGSNEKIFLHTLNGTSLAIDRTIVAIMENYQQNNSAFHIPSALMPYFS